MVVQADSGINSVRSRNVVLPRHVLPLYEVTLFMSMLPELVHLYGDDEIPSFDCEILLLIPRGRIENGMTDFRIRSNDGSWVE